MDKAELDVEVAKARLDAATAKAVFADKQWSRAQMLLPTHAIAVDEADRLECNNKVAQAELAEADAQLRIAQLGLPKPKAAATTSKRSRSRSG